jgi:5-methylcytosine-specific restriction endonuclease McrA
MNDLAHLADDVLLTSLKRLTGTANELTAQLLAHLAEVEARGIHRNMACASLYTYCVYELRMSEDEAQRRCRAARLCRQFPLLLEMLADASIHLTGILLLGPHLSDDNQREVLARARYRTKREIEKLVAEIAPRADVPARIEPLHAGARPGADHATMMAALCGPVIRSLPPGNCRGEAPQGALAELELADESSLPSASSLPEAEASPAPAMHYKVQFTADQEYVALLEEARDLLAHVNPTRDFVEVQRRALELLVAQLRKRKHAARASTASAGPYRASAAPGDDIQAPSVPTVQEPPRASAETGDSHSEALVMARPSPIDSQRTKHARRPTAAVARAVWQRDQSRCTYLDQRGQRCRETSMLEYHHEHAWALGGATTLDNLTLRCPAHNALAAEEDFGRELMQQRRRGDRGAMADR